MDEQINTGISIVDMIFPLALMLLIIASLWKVFEKAGKPGWAAIVPIYNLVVLVEIVGRPVWWVVLFIIPIANIVALFVIYIDLAKAFGKDTGFGIGLVFLSFVFLPILAFGDAQYQGEVASLGEREKVLDA